MSKVIYKYKVHSGGAVDVYMPEDAEILAVQVQLGQPVLWALVDLSSPHIHRRFWVYGTGQEIWEKDLEYVDTFQIGATMVFHVFDGGVHER